ncbi:Magnesium transporter NIPA2 [Echinococcus granulosus]|uniref:Magnesium transporter NIPA2 n=1 Tax=Echinococcus granulosus TaxID=6210 RepID=W6UYU2_ECHGR|nr:Magnesium transporter NIPA2 [Echinococcus granulosus]EUB63842.1 Magnesium transporter NIPA2 [Echinococcus granulosus]
MFQSDVHFYIGLSLALASTIFIGCSFIVKKIALRRLAATGTRAGDGGYQYLCDWVWWLGLILMGLGEAANFAGYTFAPASLVTPMGGLSVLVSAVFSSHFLGERLNFIGKIGCVVCICGSTMVVLHAPKEQEVQSLHELSIKVMDPGFLTYAIAVAVAGIVSIFVIAPKFGTRNPLVFVFISGSIGSLSVMACKGIGLGFKLPSVFGGEKRTRYILVPKPSGEVTGVSYALVLQEAIEYGILAILRQWIFWFFLIGLVFCLTVQLNYLNRALDIFNTSIVTPLLYVFFTAFVLIASTILFKEGSSLSPTDYIGNAVGLICIVSGIVLLTLFRDMNVSLGDLVKDFMGPVPTRVVHLSSDLSFKHRFSPTWCKRKGRGLSDETYTLLSTSNECSGSNESSHNSSPNHDMIEYPKLEHHHQGVHQRTGSGASAFNFASVAATTENYSTVSEAANINHSTIWTSM